MTTVRPNILVFFTDQQRYDSLGCHGPHLLKRDGWYYLLLAEGGTSFGHMCTVARSRSVWGSYEPCPHNPILTQPDPQDRIQKAGSRKVRRRPGRELVDSSPGRTAAGPRRSLPAGPGDVPGAGEMDGWPVVGNRGVPEDDGPAPGTPQRDRSYSMTDEFGAGPLDHRWEWVRRPIDDGALSGPDGLTIRCLPYDPCAYQPTQMLTKPWERDGFTMPVKTTANRGVSTSA